MASMHQKHPPPKTAVCCLAMMVRCAGEPEVSHSSQTTALLKRRPRSRGKPWSSVYLCAPVVKVWSLHRHSERRFRASNRPVERVALNRFAPGFFYQQHQVMPLQPLGRGCSRVVVNLFLDDSTVNVVGPEAERNLGDLRSHHLPVRLHVREVIKHQAADGNLLDVEHARGRKKMLQRSVRRMKGEWNKRLEAASLILQGTQFEQVVDAVFVVFDVAVEHGGVRFQPDLVGEPCG